MKHTAVLENEVLVPGVWWVDPFKLVLLFILPIFLLLTIRQALQDYTFAGQKIYFEPVYFFLVLVGILILLLGVVVGKNLKVSIRYKTEIVNANLLLLIGFITLISYVLWFYPLISNLGLVYQVFSGHPGAAFVIKSTLLTIPGITTLSQLGVVYLVFYAVYRNTLINHKLNRLLRVIFVLVLIATFFRSVVWSERLSLLEIILPVGIIISNSFFRRGRFKKALALLPIIGMGLLIVFFSLYEYNRSWVSYYSDIYDSIFLFSLDRVLEYYLVAVNNGMGMMTEFQWPTYEPVISLSFLYDFPLVGSFFSSLLGENNIANDYLYYYGDEEFNNISGLFSVLFELGVIAYIFFFFVGYCLGRFYTAAISSSYSYVVYCCLYLGILEILRHNYYGEGRFFVIILGLFFMGTFAVRRSNPVV